MRTRRLTLHLSYVNSQLAEFDLLSVGTVVAFTDLAVAVPERVLWCVTRRLCQLALLTLAQLHTQHSVPALDGGAHV